MKYSYWELVAFFRDVDICIIGSGIVGLSAAIEIKAKHPNYNVLVLEKGTLPSGASSKNAGFSCFGSPSELLDDLEIMSEDQVGQLVEKRWKGLLNLQKLIGSNLDFDPCGGHELFAEQDEALYGTCADQLNYLNNLVKNAIGHSPYVVDHDLPAKNGFHGIPWNISNTLEGSIHTGQMIRTLIEKAQKMSIRILNGLEVKDFESKGDRVQVHISSTTFSCSQLFICTNGFARKLLPELDVHPARNMVMVTNKILGLPIHGTFHMHKGYVYFRNIDERLLIGGFRHLAPEEEATSEFGSNQRIKYAISQLVKDHLLPDQEISFEYEWSGIMGVGPCKSVIIEEVEPGVICGVRLGGMGVAIGSLIGKKLAAYAD